MCVCVQWWGALLPRKRTAPISSRFPLCMESLECTQGWVIHENLARGRRWGGELLLPVRTRTRVCSDGSSSSPERGPPPVSPRFPFSMESLECTPGWVIHENLARGDAGAVNGDVRITNSSCPYSLLCKERSVKFVLYSLFFLTIVSFLVTGNLGRCWRSYFSEGFFFEIFFYIFFFEYTALTCAHFLKSIQLHSASYNRMDLVFYLQPLC